MLAAGKTPVSVVGPTARGGETQAAKKSSETIDPDTARNTEHTV
jgi:hypothetical protein